MTFAASGWEPSAERMIVRAQREQIAGLCAMAWPVCTHACSTAARTWAPTAAVSVGDSTRVGTGPMYVRASPSVDECATSNHEVGPCQMTRGLAVAAVTVHHHPRAIR